MWSISKDRKRDYVIKTGPTEKFLQNKRSTRNYGTPLDLQKRFSKTRENFMSDPQLNMI